MGPSARPTAAANSDISRGESPHTKISAVAAAEKLELVCAGDLKRCYERLDPGAVAELIARLPWPPGARVSYPRTWRLRESLNDAGEALPVVPRARAARGPLVRNAAAPPGAGPAKLIAATSASFPVGGPRARDTLRELVLQQKLLLQLQASRRFG